MIIDSRQYNGLCSCGRTHKLETELCVIESGCLKLVHAYMEKYGMQGYCVAVYDENTYKATADRHMQGYCVAVYDENTYKATADRHPQADAEVVLPAENLHANEHGVALLSERLPKETKIIIAVGAGTIHDISRYCAYERNIAFVSCPTAASVDGFCSSVAAMTWEGCKKTLPAVAPKIVVADLDIIKNAPIRLAKSGFGDMIGKYVSLTDWKISNLLTDEFYCHTIAKLTREATEQVLASAGGIATGDDGAYEKLTYGLLLSGVAMQMMGNSRPASGAEHHISHFIEMKPLSLGIDSDALHGEKVGVGTLLAIKEYHRIISLPHVSFRDYEAFSADSIIGLFGNQMARNLLDENQKDSAAGITAEKLRANWSGISQEIAKLPDIKHLKKLYGELGVKATLQEIDVPGEIGDILISNSPMVRNRLTFMRIRKCIKMDM